MHDLDRHRKGYALITAGACALGLFGVVGLAVDVGRAYIIRNEAQSYADSAALAAAAELDGTAAGFVRARDAVTSNPNRWMLNTKAFSDTQVDFATSAAGPWDGNPAAGHDYRFVRVRPTANVPLYFLPAVTLQSSVTVKVRAIAGQVERPSFREGMVPFSPFAHNSAPPDFGFIRGQRYTLRWPPNPHVGVNVCPGDDAEPWVVHAEAGGSSERGYIEETSSAIIRAAIETEYQSRTLTVGDTVFMTGGNKQTQRDSLVNRVNQDTDPSSLTYADYAAAGLGNGRRLVAAPINTGHPDFTILGFGLFFLLEPSEYPNGANNPFCAEYVGPYVQGSRREGAGGPGAYVIRLVG